MASKKNAPGNSFSLTLFDICRKKDSNGPLPEPPAFTLADRNGASRQIPFLEPDQEGGKSMQSALCRLYPLARSVFEADHVFRTVPQVLLDELMDTKKAVWQVGSDLLPVRFPRAGGFCLEKEYLLLYLEVQPVMPEIDADCLARLAVMLTSRLCCREKSCSVVREFKTRKEGSQGRSEQEIARDRFQGNDSALIKGITGEPVTVTEIFADLAGPGWESMLLDRFLLNSLLITQTDEPAPAYSHADEENLVRLARGMNGKYLPAPLEALAGHVVPVQTFANVLFMAANEGIAGHVKPALGQDFLLKQFADRHHSEYTLLFVLAVYQHYRLVDLIRKLAKKTAGLNEDNLDSGQLRKLRHELAVHEVKYVNTQPAFLTNYQQFYSGLRQGLNTGVLVEKLRRSVAELDALLADAEQQEKKRRKEQSEKGKLLLAMLAEAVALPYYLHNFLAHAVHCKYALHLTLLFTVPVLLLTWHKSGLPLNPLKWLEKSRPSS